MAESGAIKEGFLCPICHKDLRSPNGLITHFQDQHSEEQVILKSIKDLYGKAKKKILKLDEHDLESFKNEISQEKYYLEYSEPQEPGHSRSYTDYFKSIRRERLDHRTTETNKLIIRLDRLLRFYGSDRKQQEQELVAWLDGTTVTRCPSCAASFNLTRRQHHCRLCGSIMCNSCSRYLSYDMAQTLVTPVYNTETANAKDSDSLRICMHCLEMLESRRRVQIEQMMQPIICQLYAQLQKIKSQTQNSVDLYLKMYDSLTSGESTYHLPDTHSLRANIAKQAETIDTLSKKIASLPVEDDNPKVIALQNSVRKATSHYIKDCLLTLPSPPDADELERIKRERSMRHVEEDPVPKTRIRKVAVATGWSPAISAPPTDQETDPLLEQMKNVRNFIEQAKKANRHDEVVSLQENFKMLKEMYQRQQRLKQ